MTGEPGFPAKLKVARNAPETLGLPVANLATWTMSVANGLGFACRRVRWSLTKSRAKEVI